MALAAVCNLTAAGLALRRLPAAAAPPRRARPAAAPGAGGVLLAAVFLVGAASMVDQVGWTRVLSLLLGSTVYGFSLILAAFLGGLALGGIAGAGLARRSKDGARLLVLLYALVGLSSLLGLAALELRDLEKSRPTPYRVNPQRSNPSSPPRACCGKR